MKYGFIGCGNMGGALATAVSKATTDILLSDFSAEKAKNLAEKLGCSCGTNDEVFSKCESVFLGVKPQVLGNMLACSLDKIRENDPLLITMAAGVKIEKIEEMLGFRARIIRIMPNTPAAVGKGMILYTANERVTEEEISAFLSDMRFSGVLDELSENLIDAGCAVSGCGPAYMFMMIEALADGGVACGLPRDKAIKYAAATMAGSAQMVLDGLGHPEQLKDNVCSPGGTTVAGVAALEGNGFRSACIKAVQKGFEKSRELAK